MFVGDLIVRKIDRVLKKGYNIVVCFPGPKIEAITEGVEKIMGQCREGGYNCHS